MPDDAASAAAGPSARRSFAKWAEITDSSPGIQQVVSPHHPPGTAQAEGTVRCYARDGGALSPLPRLTRVIYPPDLPTPPTSLSNLADDAEYRIIGIHCQDPIFWGPETTPGVDQNNTEIFMGVEYWDSSGPGASSRVNYVLYRYLRRSRTNPRWETIWTGHNDLDYSNLVRPKHMYFTNARSNHTDPSQAGPIILAFVVSGHAQMFPDDTNVYVNSTRYLPGDTVGDRANTGGLVAPASLVAHQGRIVIFPLNVVGAGASLVGTNNEAFYWTAVNDARTRGELNSEGALVGFFQMLVGWENPTGYGVYASLTANELLLIKCRGGACILRGSLSDLDTAITLPYVRGTGMSMNIGTRAPIGYLYPVDSSGIWLWNGGEVSTHITKQMDPDFWRPPAEAPSRVNEGQTRVALAYGHGHTKCSDWNEWVLFPNNWIYDTDAGQAGAWWKIDDAVTHTIHQWAVDWRGRKAYGVGSGYRNQGDPAIYEYSMADKAITWKWRSQPLPSSLDTVLSVDQMGITASGFGNVRLTCRSEQDTVGKSMQITVANDTQPEVRLSSCGVQGTHITFDIETQNEFGDAAPTVHGVRWLATDFTPIQPSQDS